MKIFICGMIGYSAAGRLLEANRELCSARLPDFFIEQFLKLSLRNEAAKKSQMRLPEVPALMLAPLGEGGLYRGLWNLAEELGCGLSTDILKVPVSQEVTEIMEICGEDPYEADSEGSFLIAAPDSVPSESGTLEEILESVTKSVTKVKNNAQDAEKIPAAYIGHTTSSKARTIKMPEGERFLTPPARQNKDMAAKKADRAGN